MNFAFVHGGGQGSWVWDETIAALELQAGPGKARCLALDAPGCGTKRARDTSAMGWDEIVDDFVHDIEVSGLSNVILVGHSQAGTVLPSIAERRPDLIRKLVYVSCIAPDPGLTVIEMSTQRLHGMKDTPAGRALNDESMAQSERNRVMFCNDMHANVADAFLARLGEDGWPRSSYEARDWPYEHLAEVPGTYVLCLADAILPPEWQERFAERFHCNHMVRIDAGHQVMNTRPHALAEVLRNEGVD
ncbi:MAG: alpha/beta hydrolase [Novosphingobium sp.]|nr:alpha/beta hydrolase [Novosphingobium sp.]